MKYRIVSLIALTWLASAHSTAGATILPDPAPLPFARPDSPATAFDAMTTGSVPDQPATGDAPPAGPLRDGLDALDRGDVAAARQFRDALSDGSIERLAMTWAIATSGASTVTSWEILSARRALRGWPDARSLDAHMERALYREAAAPHVLERLLPAGEAQTPEGVILRVRKLLEAGDRDGARALLSPWWRKTRLEPRYEMAVIGAFSDLLKEADHRMRMERMLYLDRIGSAERAAALAGAAELARAFAAVAGNERNAGQLLEAVPGDQRSAAYVFAKSRHLRRSGAYREAAAVMLQAPDDPALLVDPDAWWIERRVLSRELLDLGDPAMAYRLAAAHAAESAVNAADAEFHAGWYAFRGLGDPRTGASHFARIAEIAEGPISLARAHYWLGRAAEAGGPGDASDHFELAARFGTTFYGQLAAARLGRDTIAFGTPAISETDQKRFEVRPAVRAIRAIEEAGHQRRADGLYRALADDMASVAEIVLLAEMARARGDHFLALRIGKQAQQRGLDVGDLAHPTGVIPSDADISGSGAALAYAIARQESEFNVAARSGAGALGLLQLLPGTARDMARKTGVEFAQARLTSDAAYNATLGTSYLDEQLSRFAGSYILTFIGYNAGPRRADEWVARYGDPRGKPIETVVDWIERIPYTETRGYVQRVMENYQVYKMRLTGRMDIEGDLVDGRRPTAD